ncbi:hypothetical protein [Kitasatospora sp. NPDC057198]|uniref:hypothetical protein n=1 Tax=Kitasatospora sp. NPDC057198 TaxID=3346046 RepID=UPI00363C8867
MTLPHPPPHRRPGSARRAFALTNGAGLLLLVLTAHSAGGLLAAPVLGPVTAGLLLLAGQALLLSATVLRYERHCAAHDAAAARDTAAGDTAAHGTAARGGARTAAG